MVGIMKTNADRSCNQGTGVLPRGNLGLADLFRERAMALRDAKPVSVADSEADETIAISGDDETKECILEARSEKPRIFRSYGRFECFVGELMPSMDDINSRLADHNPPIEVKKIIG